MDLNKNLQVDSETKKWRFKISLLVALILIFIPFSNNTSDEGTDYWSYEGIAALVLEATQVKNQEPVTDDEQPTPLSFSPNDIANKGEINLNDEKPKKIEIPEPEVTLVQEAEIYLAVEDPPQFPGGEESRHSFIRENTRYPKTANGKGIQGTVYVTFVVEPNGSLTGIKILRGIGGGCDEEALRVVNVMPKWLPGKQKGKPVRVQLNMPIKFVM